jgi:hypothetical protein
MFKEYISFLQTKLKEIFQPDLEENFILNLVCIRQRWIIREKAPKFACSEGEGKKFLHAVIVVNNHFLCYVGPIYPSLSLLA